MELSSTRIRCAVASTTSSSALINRKVYNYAVIIGFASKILNNIPDDLSNRCSEVWGHVLLIVNR